MPIRHQVEEENVHIKKIEATHKKKPLSNCCTKLSKIIVAASIQGNTMPNLFIHPNIILRVLNLKAYETLS